MPLATITLLRGNTDSYIRALSQAVHASLVEAYGMDDRDRFQIFNELDAGRLVFSPDYAGGPRSEKFMIINVTSMQRDAHAKEAFYRVLAQRLQHDAGVRPEDVFVYLSDHLALDDLSFANGISAAELAKRLGRQT